MNITLPIQFQYQWKVYLSEHPHMNLHKHFHPEYTKSVMQYKNTTKPLKAIGKELGVANILEGSLHIQFQRQY